MQVTVENTSELERKMTIQVPAEQIDSKVQSRLKELSRQVRIKGFRPGRIPISVIQQRYGRNVRQEIVGELMNQTLQEAITQESLQPVATPTVDPTPESLLKGDLEYTAVFEVFPDLGDVDIAALKIERPQAEVTPQDVDEMLLTLRQQKGEWEDKESAAATGDRVQLEYFAESEDARHPAAGRERITVVLGTEAMFEAFEAALEGAISGDQKRFELDFPESFREPVLAGKSARVEAEIVSVQASRLPELDSDFVKSYGLESGSVDDLRDEIGNNLQRELSSAFTSVMKVEVTNRLLDQRQDMPVPEGLIKNEARVLQQRTQERQRQSGVENPEEQPLNLYMDSAKKRVAAGMLMGQIARQESIELDNQRVRSAIENIANTFEQPQQVIDVYYNNPKLMSDVESAIIEEQVVDLVLEKAQVSDIPMSLKQLVARAANYR